MKKWLVLLFILSLPVVANGLKSRYGIENVFIGGLILIAVAAMVTYLLKRPR